MLFLGIVMMPFYYISKTHSVPGYLKLRFGEPARALSAISFGFMTVLMSGINMYAMAMVMKVVLGWDIHFSIWVSSVTVAVYVFLGGLLSAIFNEVLQFVLIWLGALLISILGLIETGGWSGMVARIHTNFPGQDYTHLWRTLGSFSGQSHGHQLDGHRLRPGRGHFHGLLDHRLPGRAARDRRQGSALRETGPDHRRGFQDVRAVHRHSARPAGPGCAARITPGVGEDASRAPPAAHSYNEVLPLMLARYCGPGLLGLGITALIAGFMSGMAGNVSAFATVWTYDIYRAMFRKNATDAHYVSMGRWCTIIGVLVSIGTAYLVMQFASIMDYVQALFSFFIAPLFGTVMLGMLWKRATRRADSGACWRAPAPPSACGRG